MKRSDNVNTTNVTVVIPSLNPDEKLRKTVEDLIAVGFTDILLVNDGSAPEFTGNFPKDLPGCTLLTHEINRGKGAALKTAFRYYLEKKRQTSGVITVDGDGQHIAEDVLRCAAAMCETGSLILGVRDFSEPHVPPRSRFGNKTTSLVFRLFCGLRISDTQTGLRAIPAKFLPDMIAVDGDRYEYETNMLLMMSSLNIPYREEKIHTVYIEENKTSHFRPIRDSIRIYGLILKFISSSAISAVVDLGMYYLLAKLSILALGAWADVIYGVAARVISSLFNYWLNKKAVFKSGASSKTTLLRYYVLALVIMAISSGAMGVFSLLTNMVGGEYALLKTIVKFAVDTVLFLVSFRAQREWVFADNNTKKR